jgi:glucuronate isomerase
MPGLFREIREKLAEIPVVDIHTHINPEKPHAERPEDVILYHYIVTELATAGVSRDILEKADMNEVLKKMRLIKNTSTYWCLLKIMNDLYELGEERLKPEEWSEARRIIESTSKSPGWVERVLHGKIKTKRVFITLDYASPIPNYDPTIFVGGLRIDPLISRLSKGSLDKLGKVAGVQITTLRDLDEGLDEIFKAFSKHIKTVTVSLQPEDEFKHVDSEEVGDSLKRIVEGFPLRPQQFRSLSSHIICKVSSLCQEYDVVFQIMLGVRRPVAGASPPDYAIVAFNTNALTNYCEALFSRFKNVKFDLILANSIQSHEIAVIAKNYPNVYFSGFWWYSFYPHIIRWGLLERIQMLPRNKVNAFFSDAYVIEWIYGKSCLLKDQLAYVLADMVEHGYYDKDFALEMAEDLLCKNPTMIYQL